MNRLLPLVAARNGIRGRILCTTFLSLLCAPYLADCAEGDVHALLQRLKGDYERLSAYHAEGSVQITYYDPAAVGDDPTIARGHHRSWGRGIAHRVDYQLDSQVFPGIDYSGAFNGSIHQNYNRSADSFTFGKGDFDFNVSHPENPLFYPVIFLTQNDDLCVGCLLRLSHVKDSARWEKILDAAHEVREPGQSPRLRIVEVPGGTTMGEEFTYRIYFDREGGESKEHLPIKIERVSTAGQVLTSYEIERYREVSGPNGKMYLPEAVKSTITAPGTSTPIAIEETEWDVLEIDQAYPEDVFELDFSAAKVIWDDDSRLFLRQGGDRFSQSLLDAIDKAIDEASSAGSRASSVAASEPSNRQAVSSNAPSPRNAPLSPVRSSPITSPGISPLQAMRSSGIFLFLASGVAIASAIGLLLILTRRNKTP